MTLPFEPAVEESALASVVSRILEMSPEELYDLSDDERQELWRSLDGNCTRVREAQSFLRLKHRVDFEEDKILELFTYPLYSNLYDPEEHPEQAKKYEDKVVSMLDRCRMLFSRYKKYFSSTDIDAFENAFRQSREQKRIYEGDIDSANKLLLTSFAWKHNPKFSSITDEVCR